MVDRQTDRYTGGILIDTHFVEPPNNAETRRWLSMIGSEYILTDQPMLDTQNSWCGGQWRI